MRKFVYLLVMAALAAGVYFFVEKKSPELASTPAVPPVDASAEQASSAPSDVPVDQNAPSDAEHASSELSAAFGKLSDFTLTNQAGQEFHMAAMKGKVLLLNTFFTKCQGPCPVMNKKMEGFQEKFANDTDVHLVSITVDPANDTAEVLKTYAETYKANPEKWSFLTGSKEVIDDILGKQLKFAVDDIQTHSTRFVLIDKEGNIKALYDSSSEEDLTKLEADVRQLVASAS